MSMQPNKPYTKKTNGARAWAVISLDLTDRNCEVFKNQKDIKLLICVYLPFIMPILNGPFRYLDSLIRQLLMPGVIIFVLIPFLRDLFTPYSSPSCHH